MRYPPEVEPIVIRELERDWGLIGYRTADIPKLAGFRQHFRHRFYCFANGFAGLATAQAVIALNGHGIGQVIAFPGFVLALAGFLFNEFGARVMTRQLNRRAAEQIYRDLNGING